MCCTSWSQWSVVLDTATVSSSTGLFVWAHKHSNISWAKKMVVGSHHHHDPVSYTHLIMSKSTGFPSISWIGGNIFPEWMTVASPNNYGTISRRDGEVWDVRGSTGVTSSNLCLFEKMCIRDIVSTVYVQVVISEVLRFIIGRYNCNTIVFYLSWHFIACEQFLFDLL